MGGALAAALVAEPPAPAWEFYETPATFTRYLFSQVTIVGAALEPCAGRGAIVQAAPQDGSIGWRTNDLDRRWPTDTHMDAADPHAWAGRSWDWVISNPPFTPAFAILRSALAAARVGVAMHLRASVHEVLKRGPRRTFMHEHPPTGILYLPRFAYTRSPTTGKWATDNMGACWVIWLTDPRAGQFIRYAPPAVVDELTAETPHYRAAMDELTR